MIWVAVPRKTELSTMPLTDGRPSGAGSSPPSPGVGDEWLDSCRWMCSFSGRTTAWQRSPAANPSTSASTSTPLSRRTVPRPAAAAATVPGIRFDTPMKPATKVVAGRS